EGGGVRGGRPLRGRAQRVLLLEGEAQLVVVGHGAEVGDGEGVRALLGGRVAGLGTAAALVSPRRVGGQGGVATRSAVATAPVGLAEQGADSDEEDQGGGHGE